jgi:2-hydroxychromene-2-carboxylate isomerase
MSDTVPTTPPESDSSYDVEFFWDPVCPFAWLTSRWMNEVAAQRDFRVDWRFISLRLINKDKDYATHFPAGYEFGHTAGLRMLRVAARIRHELGRDALGPVVTAYGESYFDKPKGSGMRDRLSTPDHLAEVLERAGLDAGFAGAADDTSWDALIDAEGEMALARTGRDVGTPIITFGVPDGMSFFGPVISRVPRGADAVRLWDALTELASFPGFAEVKRSLREVPQLNIFGGLVEEPTQEDWEAGHRRMDD